MTQSDAAVAAAVPSKGLLARAIGVVLSPRETYADIVARPRVLGALGLVLAIMIAVSSAFAYTQVGRDLMIEQGVAMLESFNVQVTDQMYDTIEQQANQPPYRTAIAQLIFIPTVAAIIAGLILAVFTATLGGDAKFKQVYAVVIYSCCLLALQTFFVYPMFYLKESMSSPTSLAVFLPFLDDASFLGRFIGAFDLFRLWWVVNLSIGVGVLYKRRTSPIAWSMLAVYAFVSFVYAGVATAFSGA